MAPVALRLVPHERFARPLLRDVALTGVPGIGAAQAWEDADPDAWHSSRGYVGERRAAECYLWSKTTGYYGHYSSNVVGK